MRRIVTLCALALAAVACASPEAAPAQASLIDDGREIAMAQCSSCHAVGAYGDGPQPEAPPFRTVLSRYNAEVLEEELIAGIRVTHPMPAFQLDPEGVDALIAYLQSIQTE